MTFYTVLLQAHAEDVELFRSSAEPLAAALVSNRYADPRTTQSARGCQTQVALPFGGDISRRTGHAGHATVP